MGESHQEKAQDDGHVTKLTEYNDNEFGEQDIQYTEPSGMGIWYVGSELGSAAAMVSKKTCRFPLTWSLPSPNPGGQMPCCSCLRCKLSFHIVKPLALDSNCVNILQ
jgi:hypothetical protein